MAQYRFSAAIVCRSEGQSAVAAAAYRAGEKLHDERTGEIKDYARRSWSVLYTQILTPENAPEWMRDRQRLWNGVERREDRSTKRGTAQLARNIELSLPHELTHEQHVQLVCEFVKDEFVDRGMVADIAIHAPPYRGDGTNHHAHILLTMRDIDDGVFGNKNRAWNKEELLEHWRERWADYQNRALEKYGHEARVDHRSLKDQGLDREPTIHLGPNAQALEDQGIPTDRGDQNRRIKSNNDNLDLAKKDLADSEKRLAALRRRFAAERMEQIQKTFRAADSVWKKGLDKRDTPGPRTVRRNKNRLNRSRRPGQTAGAASPNAAPPPIGSRTGGADPEDRPRSGCRLEKARTAPGPQPGTGAASRSQRARSQSHAETGTRAAASTATRRCLPDRPRAAAPHPPTTSSTSRTTPPAPRRKRRSRRPSASGKKTKRKKKKKRKTSENESRTGNDDALRRRGPAGADKPIPPPLPVRPSGKPAGHLQAGEKTTRHLPTGCLALDGLQPAGTAQNAVALDGPRNDGPRFHRSKKPRKAKSPRPF